MSEISRNPNQEEFQTTASKGLDGYLSCETLTLSDTARDALIAYIAMAAASSDQPVSLRERLALAEQELHGSERLSAREAARVRLFGRDIIFAAIKI